MAVLMVVIGPQLLRNVEKSRIQRDNTAISEIANAAKIAMADETVNNTIANGASVDIQASGGTFTFTAGTGTLQGELNLTLGSTVSLSSSVYKSATNQPGITVAKDATGNITVTGLNLVQQDGSTALTITY